MSQRGFRKTKSVSQSGAEKPGAPVYSSAMTSGTCSSDGRTGPPGSAGKSKLPLTTSEDVLVPGLVHRHGELVPEAGLVVDLHQPGPPRRAARRAPRRAPRGRPRTAGRRASTAAAAARAGLQAATASAGRPTARRARRARGDPARPPPGIEQRGEPIGGGRREGDRRCQQRCGERQREAAAGPIGAGERHARGRPGPAGEEKQDRVRRPRGGSPDAGRSSGPSPHEARRQPAADEVAGRPAACRKSRAGSELRSGHANLANICRSKGLSTLAASTRKRRSTPPPTAAGGRDRAGRSPAGARRGACAARPRRRLADHASGRPRAAGRRG